MRPNLSPRQHPNAYAASTVGSLAALLVWAEGHWITVPPDIAVSQATVLIALALGVGRILTGQQKGPPPGE